MVDNNSISSHNNPEKRSNPFKKMLNNMMNFMKKDEEDNKSPSFEESKNGKNQDSKIPKFETPETRGAKKSMSERKANKKEQKLPKKLKKGW